MKAIVQNSYGSKEALTIKEVKKPKVKDNEVLIHVHATCINAGDLFTLKGNPWLVRFYAGFPNPTNFILGWDVAGKVEDTGKKVTQFKKGDEVYCSTNYAYAEFVTAAESRVALKPANLTFEQAAAFPTSAITALNGLRDAGKIKAGQKILINGASGGVGIFAVQIAKSFDAEVTGVCSSKNIDLVRSVGADHVVDYTGEDFTKQDKRYDLILDNIASRSFKDLRRALTPNGVIISNSGHGGMKYVFKAFILSLFIRQVGGMFNAKANTENLNTLTKLAEEGKIKPIIDKTYPFKKIPEALDDFDKKHASGKLVISMMSEGSS